MTIRSFLKLTTALVLWGVLGTANAASISIIPNSTGAVGDVISLEIIADFGDVVTIGGGFDVVYDSSHLRFLGFESSYPGDPGFSRQPDVFDGLLEGFAFGDFNGLTGDLGVIGTLTFEILTRARSTVVGQETNSITGPFIDANTFQPLLVEYEGALVSSIALPVPAAVWLMLGGLGALFSVGRRRS